MGDDPQLADPENGDFRPHPDSPAVAYGCQTFRENLGFSDPRRASRVDDRLERIESGRAVEVSGTIVEDTVWAADTVHVVGEVTVADAVTLTIRPGVRILFAEQIGLTVSGTLHALGRPDDPILMSSAYPQDFVVDSSSAGSWSGIRFDQTSATNDSSLLEYCILEYCKSAGGGSRGGALSVTGFSKLRVSNTVFHTNVADHGAAVYCATFAAPVFSGCLMFENYAFISGSAVFCIDAYPDLINCTIVGNPVLNEDAFHSTAAIHNHLSKSRPVNSIIRDNGSTYFLGGQILEGKGFYTIYNNVEDGHAGIGNFDANPLFAGEGMHPFEILDGSPCINTGTPDPSGLALPVFDLAGKPRIRGGRIDVGAYEWLTVAGVEPVEPTRVAAKLRSDPNPFASTATISFQAGRSGSIRLNLFDSRGRRVRELLAAVDGPGRKFMVWDGRDDRGVALPSGIYFARINIEGETRTQKVVMAR